MTIRRAPGEVERPAGPPVSLAAGHGWRLTAHAGSTGAVLEMTALLRLPLILLLSLLGWVVPDPRVEDPGYHLVVAAYGVAALLWCLWVRRTESADWLVWVSASTDIGVLLVLAALSGGPTSLLQPLFFLLPVATAMYGRPRFTLAVGIVMAAAYLVTWLTSSGDELGPRQPALVWLHFGFLLWLTVASAYMSWVLVRRANDVQQLLNTRRQLIAASTSAEERERARIAEQLHDGPLQLLLVARMDLEVLAQQLHDQPKGTGRDPSGGTPPVDMMSDVTTVLTQCAQQIRSVVTVLHPQVLAQLGLTAAIRELAAEHATRTGQTVTVTVDDVDTPHHQDLLYSTARELLNNIGKHADASEITVTLKDTGDELHLLIQDDGRGFDPQVVPDRVAAGHIGLAAHITRVQAAGGRFTIDSQPGHGTTVSVTVPRA